MKYYLLFITNFLSITFLFSQTKDTDIKYIKQLKSNYSQYNTREEKKEFDEYFETLEHNISLGYTKNGYVSDTDYLQFIQNIFSTIISKNSSYKINSPKYYITKSNIPNASSLGFDFYTIESGILSFLENEFQVAAVICHEIAHNQLNHTKKSIEQDAEFVKDFKREIKSLKRKDFLKLIKSQDEVIRKKYDLAEQSRKNEISADSLGFILYANLGYPKNQYLELLINLEKYNNADKIVLDDTIYKHLYDLPNQKFDDKLIKLEKNLLFDGLTFKEYLDEDSIRTHPNLEDRLKWIKKNFADDFLKQEVKASAEFEKIKKKEINQYYENYFQNDQFSVALYLLMFEKQNLSTRIDLDKNIATVFDKLYTAKKELKFNKYVPQVDPNSENENYQKLLTFLWNLKTDELKNIADYYTKKATN